MTGSRNILSPWARHRQVRCRDIEISNTAGRTTTNALFLDIDGTVTRGLYIDNDGTMTNAIRIDSVSGKMLTMASSEAPLVVASGTIPLELYTTTSDTSSTVTSGYIKLVHTANTRANQIEAFVVEVESEYETGDWCNAIVARLDYGTTGDAAGGMAAPLVSELNYGAHSYGSGGGQNYVLDLEMNCPTNFVCDAGITAHPQAFVNIAIWGGATAIGTWEDYGFFFRTDGFDAAAGNMISVNSQTIRVRVEDDSGDPVTRYLMLSESQDVLSLTGTAIFTFTTSGGSITAAAASTTLYGGGTNADALILQGASTQAADKITITGGTGTVIAATTSIDLAGDTIYLGTTGEGYVASAATTTTIYGGNAGGDNLVLRSNSSDTTVLTVDGATGLTLAGTVTTGLDISTASATGITINTSAPTTGLLISAICGTGINISGAMTTGTAIAITSTGTLAGTLKGIVIDYDGVTLGTQSNTGIEVLMHATYGGTGTEYAVYASGDGTTVALCSDAAAAMTIGGTVTTGLIIGACTTGIDFTGSMDVSTGIKFTNATFKGESNRDNRAIEIGGRGANELSIATAGSVGAENFEPIQMNFDFAGTDPQSTSTVNIWQGAITLDTGALSKMRLKWTDLLTTVTKNVTDVYIHQAEIVLGGTTTISNEVAVLGLVCNAGSGTITCGTYNGVNITMRGSGTPAQASGLMIHGTGSCTLPYGISIYGTPQPTIGICLGNYANDNQGPTHAFFIPSGPGADAGSHVNTAESGDGAGSIKIKVGSTTKYLQYWDNAS